MNDVHAQSAFPRMRDAFEYALKAREDVARTYFCVFAGRNARIRFVGSRCADAIAPAFEHLFEAAETAPHPDLTIDVWDEEQTGARCPAPWAAPDGTSSEFGFIVGSADDRFVGCRRPGLLAWIDRSLQRIIACTRDSRSLEAYERAKPLLFPLLLWHCDREVEVIHGALVEKEGHGILLAGAEGTGKSTAAMACMQGGFTYLGDDYIGLQTMSGGSFVGHSLYNAVWLDRVSAQRFPDAAAQAIPALTRKSPILLAGLYPGRCVRVASIRFLVLPKPVDAHDCRLLPASKREALFALAPTSVIKRPCAGQAGLDKIAALVENVPAHTLELGTDIKGLAACIDDFRASSTAP